MRRVELKKAPGTPDWWLKWTDANDLLCVAFFSTCMGKPLLSIDKKEFCGPQVSRMVHTLNTRDLMEWGMVEEFTTTQKLENLVTRCVWEFPAKQRQLKQLEGLIQEKQEHLLELSGQIRELESFLNELLPKMAALDTAVDRAVKKMEYVTRPGPESGGDQRRSG